MAVLIRFIESFLLIFMGSFMAMLARSPIYWQFIHPKYSWLTFVSGVILIIVGFGCFFHTQRKRKVSELLGVLSFLVLAGTAITTSGSLGMPETKPSMGGGGFTMEYPEEKISPTMEIGGREYTKINVAELLLGESEGFVKPGNRFAIQGTVVRAPELDREGYICVGRLLITCCFADSTAVLTPVKVDDPERYQSGAWVRAVGTIEEKVLLPGMSFTLPGALTAVRSDIYIMHAIEVEEVSVEGVPFIFDIQGQAPFSY
ncbi:hypothetical protein [Maridesulfovibrio sp.]|uniref:TIGR03943 family putative permease subunit n=1 Tax=Maridesulfovibrio sp. TaxID=2795000 RepID=UPI0039EFFCD4